jgi:hypothetical protein
VINVKMTKKERVQRIQARLASDDDFLSECICILYTYQTNDEKHVRGTTRRNNVGFNKPDAAPLSKCAEWLRSGRRLGQRFLYDARDRMRKYAKQLAGIPEVDAALNDCSEVMGRVEHETGGAVLLRLGAKNPIWVPKSLIYSEFDSKDHAREQVLAVKRWFVEKRLRTHGV